MNTAAPVGTDSIRRSPINCCPVSFADPACRDCSVVFGVLVDGTGPDRPAATPTTAGGPTGSFVDRAAEAASLVGILMTVPAGRFVGMATDAKSDVPMGNAEPDVEKGDSRWDAGAVLAIRSGRSRERITMIPSRAKTPRVPRPAVQRWTGRLVFCAQRDVAPDACGAGAVRDLETGLE
jgi:hypothetical protein